jgi:hypothetical protein
LKGRIVKISLTTTNRQAPRGQVAFVRAAVTMSLGGCPVHARRDAYGLERDEQVQPGEGGVEAQATNA